MADKYDIEAEELINENGDIVCDYMSDAMAVAKALRSTAAEAYARGRREAFEEAAELIRHYEINAAVSELKSKAIQSLSEDGAGLLRGFPCPTGELVRIQPAPNVLRKGD